MGRRGGEGGKCIDIGAAPALLHCIGYMVKASSIGMSVLDAGACFCVVNP